MILIDTILFVQNVRTLCLERGIKPTVACKDSGIGTSFINNIEKRGQIPSVAKVQLLAQYLGVTTSQLLGETELPPYGSLEYYMEEDLIKKYRKDLIVYLMDGFLDQYHSLSPEGQEKTREYLSDLVASGRYKKDSQYKLGEKHA